MVRRFQRFSFRFVLEVTFVLAAGLAGYQAVYTGEANRWPSFQVREGYWGTQFLSPVLYAMGNDRVCAANRLWSLVWLCSLHRGGIGRGGASLPSSGPHDNAWSQSRVTLGVVLPGEWTLSAIVARTARMAA